MFRTHRTWYLTNSHGLQALATLLLGLCLSITGCSETPEQQASLRLSAPEQITSSRAVNLELLSAFVEIDGVRVNVSPNDGRSVWSGSFELPDDRAVSLVVEWMQEGLLIARYANSVGPVVESTRLVVDADDYEFTGAEFDFDNDGMSNLEEFRRDTNPRDPLDIDVRIQKAEPGRSPTINGQPGVLWADAPMVAAWKSDFLIDNLMIDAGADYPDGDTGFVWQAVYDDTYLYILVLAEPVDRATLQADSSIGVRDDALNIFIDGDNSKGETYDGIDDYHLVIPFLKLLKPDSEEEGLTPLLNDEGDLRRDTDGNLVVLSEGMEISVAPGDFQANDTRDTDGRIARGQNSLPVIDDYRVVNGIRVVDQHVYELRLNLAELNIVPGRPFGFDLQIDDDNDGAGRDSRYGWRHPSRSTITDSDSNNTASNPSYMGTAVLD